MLDKAYFPVNFQFAWIKGITIWALSKIITPVSDYTSGSNMKKVFNEMHISWDKNKCVPARIKFHRRIFTKPTLQKLCQYCFHCPQGET